MAMADAVVDPVAVAETLRAVRELLRPGAGLIAVVKANAYGHGGVEVARDMVAVRADACGVAHAEEGILLRRAGVGGPILVMGPTPPEGAEALLEHRLE